MPNGAIAGGAVIGPAAAAAALCNFRADKYLCLSALYRVGIVRDHRENSNLNMLESWGSLPQAAYFGGPREKSWKAIYVMLLK
ncbi:MAG: hypothetical protein ACYSYL_20640 [Planctomycetota bacterium]|jgi:hypothetical protein